MCGRSSRFCQLQWKKSKRHHWLSFIQILTEVWSQTTETCYSSHPFSFLSSVTVSTVSNTLCFHTYFASLSRTPLKINKSKTCIFYSKCNHYSPWFFNVFAGESNGNVVRPNQPSVVLTEGSSTTLSCSYDGSAYSLHWYRQKPGSKPEFLRLIVESSKYVTKADQPHPHMSITLHDNKSVDLEITSAAVSDSALYYCALQPTVTGKQTTLYKNLFLI